MSTAPPELDDIRRKMAQIRRDLHNDVKSVVQGAEAATDWRRFIKGYPWASVGVALAAGYFIVPRRHRRLTTTEVAAMGISPVASIAPSPIRSAEPEKKQRKGKGILGSLFGMLAPVALRAAQGYALQFAEQWMAQRVGQQMQLHPELAAALGGQNRPHGGGPGPGPGYGQGPQDSGQPPRTPPRF